ncbi:hypothetical protein AB0M43_00810 [Longispora sp. NPDC051575]|uniref:hypothetical protein n=1 Tax=Longispora sp. NPDC051575 TaxID=3154943 RepID=UPI003441A0AC
MWTWLAAVAYVLLTGVITFAKTYLDEARGEKRWAEHLARERAEAEADVAAGSVDELDVLSLAYLAADGWNPRDRITEVILARLVTSGMIRRLDEKRYADDEPRWVLEGARPEDHTDLRDHDPPRPIFGAPNPSLVNGRAFHLSDLRPTGARLDNKVERLAAAGYLRPERLEFPGEWSRLHPLSALAAGAAVPVGAWLALDHAWWRLAVVVVFGLIAGFVARPHMTLGRWLPEITCRGERVVALARQRYADLGPSRPREEPRTVREAELAVALFGTSVLHQINPWIVLDRSWRPPQPDTSDGHF